MSSLAARVPVMVVLARWFSHGKYYTGFCFLAAAQKFFTSLVPPSERAIQERRSHRTSASGYLGSSVYTNQTRQPISRPDSTKTPHPRNLPPIPDDQFHVSHRGQTDRQSITTHPHPHPVLSIHFLWVDHLHRGGWTSAKHPARTHALPSFSPFPCQVHSLLLLFSRATLYEGRAQVGLSRCSTPPPLWHQWRRRKKADRHTPLLSDCSSPARSTLPVFIAYSINKSLSHITYHVHIYIYMVGDRETNTDGQQNSSPIHLV
ncbi:hypothetical protein B0T17DRAFT_624249 [Bombardia bombarda]|uniref:Uncharacterized protein n=1 Tax=Bombardia bombarda TaxID=252184 RepID=A0AA39XK80_9PEZI|nr:hypothetical protein B0T17DRAFT_624249 [Bombardia bombarda]